MGRRADSSAQCGPVAAARLRIFGAIAGLIALQLQPVARAEPPRALATQLVYSAPAACPRQAELERRLRARLHGVALDTAAGNTRLQIRIEQRGRVRGSIVLSSPERVLGQRDIEASRCSEAVDALAFIAALLLEEGARASAPKNAPADAPASAASPSAATSGEPLPTTGPVERARQAQPATPVETDTASGERRAPDRSAAPANSEPAESVDSAARRAPLDVAPPAQQAVAEAVTPAMQTARQPHTSAPRASLLRSRAGGRASTRAGVAIVSGVAPSPRPGLSLGAGVLLVDGAHAALSLDLGMRASLPQQVPSRDGAGRFSWWSSVGLLCADVRVASKVGASLCATAELGRLVARGLSTDDAVTRRARWLALGPTARVAVQLLGPLWLEPALGVLLPTTRDRFVVGESELHAVPRLTFRGELSLRVRLP